jgi:hypothetical protein
VETYMSLMLPVLGAVDRSETLDIFMTAPRLLTDPFGNQELARFPVGNAVAGALPGDPAWFPESVNPRVAVCQILSGYAAARCLRGPGYF